MAIYRPAVEDGQQSSEPAPGSGPQDKVNNNSITRRLSSKDSLRDSMRDSTTSIRDFVNENPYVSALNKLRLLCGDIVNHPTVQLIIIFLIVVNAVMMGVATFDFVTENPAVDNAFETTDEVFLIIFTVELCMQFVFRGYTLFKDGWLVFDLIIIVLSWSFASLQIIRAFRIFRALRIITRIQTMRNLVSALFDIMPRLGAICALLLLIFYIFAVLFTQLFGELELSGEYFTSLENSLMTLFVMMTMEWADVARECMAQIWWAWVPFVTFIMITGFIVFNLIIAVVCDAVAVIENKEDLEPDFFAGMLGSKDMEEEEDALAPSMDKTSHNNCSTYEEELVENLANRMSSVLKSQKEMLETLEALTKDSLIPTAAAAMQRRNSYGEEEDKMSEDS